MSDKKFTKYYLHLSRKRFIILYPFYIFLVHGKYVYITSSQDTFLYSFFLILLICILWINKVKYSFTYKRVCFVFSSTEFMANRSYTY